MTKTSRKKSSSVSSVQPKKRERKPPSGTRLETGSGSVETQGRLRVRMYRVGFGDFFLMTIPTDSGPEHILIDCGVTNGRTGKGDIAAVTLSGLTTVKRVDEMLGIDQILELDLNQVTDSGPKRGTRDGIAFGKKRVFRTRLQQAATMEIPHGLRRTAWSGSRVPHHSGIVITQQK